MAPAEPHEVVAQGRGHVAHGAIGFDAEGTVALGELGAVRSVDQRHMGEDRKSYPTERLVDLRLPRGIGEVIVAADDMGDAHVVVATTTDKL